MRMMSKSTSRVTCLAAVLALVALPAVLPTSEALAKDKANFAQVALGTLSLGTPVQTDQLVLFPIVSFGLPSEVDAQGEPKVLVDRTATKLSFSEPEIPSRRYNITAKNEGAKPALLMGGTVLVGGIRDRLVRRDTIVPAGASLEVECLPASAKSDARKTAAPFTVSGMLAPPYLRKKADFGASLSLVPNFIRKYLEFRDAKDDRESLAAIGESDALEAYCLACHKSLASFPDVAANGNVVGAVGVVRGRVQLIVIFGENAQLKSSFEPLLKGFTYAAAAIELRAKKAGIPIPGRDDPKKTIDVARKQATKLLAQLGKARFKKEKSATGETLAFRTSSGMRGRATGLGGELVHLVAFPYDPFESALYRTALDLPEPGEGGGTSGENPAESFTRRGAGRLTEAERRLLRRLRGGARGVGGVRRR